VRGRKEYQATTVPGRPLTRTHKTDRTHITSAGTRPQYVVGLHGVSVRAGKIPSYAEIIKTISDAIARLGGSGNVSSLVVPGTSLMTLNRVKIPTIKFSPISEVRPKNIAILVAGIHGDEFYGTTAVHEVIKALQASYATPDTGPHHNILKAMEIWVVAIANPDRHLIIEELAKHTVKTATSLDSRLKSANYICNNHLPFGRKNVCLGARDFKTHSGTGQTVNLFPFGSASVDLSTFLDAIQSDLDSKPEFKGLVIGGNAHVRKGIDINRNFPKGFSVNSDEYSDTYSGIAASSELETLAVQAVIDAAVKTAVNVRGGKVRILIDVHQEKFGVFRAESDFRDKNLTDKAIIAELEKPNVTPEGTLGFFPSDPDMPLGSCEDYARDKGVEYSLTLEITEAGAGTGRTPSFPAKDTEGKAIPVETIAENIKDLILRILEHAAAKK
jgi:hypothetical protein